MLHNVYAKLVADHGYAKDAMTNPIGTAGNVVFLHLFIDSLSLLPCNPDCEYPHYHFQDRCDDPSGQLLRHVKASSRRTRTDTKVSIVVFCGGSLQVVDLASMRVNISTTTICLLTVEGSGLRFLCAMVIRKKRWGYP